MPNYRRARVVGATYFFTVNLADRSQRLLIDHADVLRDVFRDTKTRLPFKIDAVVILPDHMHCLWTLPAGDADFSARWRRIKTGFSKHVAPLFHPEAARNGRHGIWQRGFWEHLVRNDADYAAHVAYIHYNPVKHGHVGRVADWPYSSSHRFVRYGLYPVDWAGGEKAPAGRYGEA